MDGTDDIAVAVERYPGGWSHQRTLFVMLNEGDGEYTVRWRGGELGGRFEGGVWGDSFAGIGNEDGVLTLSLFGGSSDRWGFERRYRIQDGELILYVDEYWTFSTFGASGVRSIFYVEPGIVEDRSICDVCHEFNNLLSITTEQS